MKKYNAGLLGIKESESGKYCLIDDIELIMESEINRLKTDINEKELIIERYRKEMSDANEIFSDIVRKLVSNMKDSREKDRLVREVYGIEEDFEDITIEMQRGRKTKIEIVRKI